jgi:hypothetical protein
MIAGFLSSMAFIRGLLKSLLSFLDIFTLEDAYALLSGAGVTVFYFDSGMLGTGDEEDEFGADAPLTLLTALCLETTCPVVAWKCQEISPGFLWKKESDLSVRDWIYLTRTRLGSFE